MQALLNHTDSIIARQRISTIRTSGADEVEGEKSDVKLLKITTKALYVICHSEGQDKPDHIYIKNSERN